MIDLLMLATPAGANPSERHAMTPRRDA